MLHLCDHAAHFRRVLQRCTTAELVQPEPDQRLALIGRAADGAAGLLHNYRLGHRSAPQPSAAAEAASTSRRRDCSEETLMPRRAATERGLSSCLSASKVARTML